MDWAHMARPPTPDGPDWSDFPKSLIAISMAVALWLSWEFWNPLIVPLLVGALLLCILLYVARRRRE
jgi:predicted PurR-regulated permease PerM